MAPSPSQRIAAEQKRLLIEMEVFTQEQEIRRFHAPVLFRELKEEIELECGRINKASERVSFRSEVFSLEVRDIVNPYGLTLEYQPEAAAIQCECTRRKVGPVMLRVNRHPVPSAVLVFEGDALKPVELAAKLLSRLLA
ncbi:MAG TPA: hypothetical protein VHY84_20585 [Bryobacteraceae bacterium]|jgi:hypothetical protein|nr:hypothetical protein [Bryobacteraceae bacterium]